MDEGLKAKIMAKQNNLRELAAKQPSLRELMAKQSNLRQLMEKQPRLREVMAKQSNLLELMEKQPSLRESLAKQSNLREFMEKQPSLRELLAKQPRIDDFVVRLPEIDQFVAKHSLSEAIEQLQSTHSPSLPSQPPEATYADEISEFLNGESIPPTLDFSAWASEMIKKAGASYEKGEMSKKALAAFVGLILNLVAGCILHYLLAAQPTISNSYDTNVSISYDTNFNYYDTNVLINLNLPQEDYKKLRIVFDGAQVHSRSLGRSAIVDFLCSGSTVEILGRRKKWRLVRWVNCDEEYSEGWVRAKHLRKVKPLSRHFKWY